MRTGPRQWNSDWPDVADIRKIGPGWYISDFGKGQFKDEALVLFTLRNGSLEPGVSTQVVPYAETLLVSRDGQVALMQNDRRNFEDIIVRDTAPPAVRLHQVAEVGSLDMESLVVVRIDDVRHVVVAGGIVLLDRCASNTIEPGRAHAFWGCGGRIV